MSSPVLSLSFEDAFKSDHAGRGGSGDCARNESREVVSETAMAHWITTASGKGSCLGRGSAESLCVWWPLLKLAESGCGCWAQSRWIRRALRPAQGHREAHSGIPCRGVVPRTGVKYTGSAHNRLSGGTNALWWVNCCVVKNIHLEILLLKFCTFFLQSEQLQSSPDPSNNTTYTQGCRCQGGPTQPQSQAWPHRTSGGFWKVRLFGKGQGA